MDKFLTLELAWEEFKKQSDIVEVTGGDMNQVQAAKDLFFAGAQGALFALAHIKEYVSDNPREAVPHIMNLYKEASEHIDDANRRAREYEERQRELEARKSPAAWPFPTGEKPGSRH